MTILDYLQLGFQPTPLRFLVIGGYAVSFHGHSRITVDLDLLIKRSEKDSWIDRILATGLKKTHEANTFVQFELKGSPPLDLMMVNDHTFEEMWSGSVEKEMQGLWIRVPSVDHLLALKLHALKQKPPHRTSKDAEDVEMLIRRNNLDLTEPRYRKLFLKYGTEDIYETIMRILRY